ncbi:MAG: heme biosynthesis HemY N-terminal domain-containing protein [Steroidobacteraceae bacterium]
MKQGIYVALALLIGGLLATLLLDDPGRVVLGLHGYLIEMSLPVAVLLLLGIYVGVRLCIRLIRVRRRTAEERAARQRDRSHQQLAQGLEELSAGEWSTAEQTLTRSAFGASHPLVHYLAAARAAELQGAPARRDEWLAKALDVAPEQRAAVHITQAEMLLRHNQLAAALTTLEQLDASGHQNARGLSLLARIYRQQGDWQKLKLLEPRLRSTAGIQASAVDEILAQVHLDMLKAAGNAANTAQLEQAWREVPKSMAKRPDMVVTYARAAMTCHAHPQAEKALRELLNEHWDETAVLAYGELAQSESGMDEPLTLLQTVEKWLNARPQDAALLLTCARCCIRNELYGKARSYLEASLGLRPRLETYQMLAKLLEATGEREQAFKLLNEALVQAVGRKALLPRLRALRMVERRQGIDRRTRQ